MASRNFFPHGGSYHADMKTLCGFLSIKADASIDATLSRFRNATLAAGATGIYTITLSDKFVGKHHVQLTPLKAAAADTQWEVVSAPGINGTTGQVITLRHVKSSDGTAVAPGAVCGVMITVNVSNSPVGA